MVMPVLILFLFYHLALLLWLIWGAWQLSQLPSEIPGTPSTNLPSLTIVVPARNEENTISLGLTSLSSLSYPRLSIIVVNDRSEDATGKHIADFEKQDPRIRCEVVKQLPSDWLGKNHALQLGAESSESELILFTDADVEIDDDFLKRAVTFFQQKQLDHLAGIPRVVSTDPLLYSLLGVFGLAFSLATRPWQGKDPKKDRAVGIGAFNLVRRTSYLAMGGHRELKLRPDDDLKLALLMKRHGFKTDCIKAVNGLQVEWYPNIPALARGLEKNIMTDFEYSFFKAFLANSIFAVTFLLPFLLLFIMKGPAFVVTCISVGLLLIAYLGQLREAKMPLWCVPFFPLATFLILIIFSRACFLTYFRKGVYWRDTFYSLELLRSNIIPRPRRRRSPSTIK